jgi:hypothetical protein
LRRGPGRAGRHRPWLGGRRSEDGTRRLDDPDDFVRLELEAALARGIRVIPVLVDRAPLPRSDSLPEGSTIMHLALPDVAGAVRKRHSPFG